jgi:hypothetical protein
VRYFDRRDASNGSNDERDEEMKEKGCLGWNRAREYANSSGDRSPKREE